MAVSPAPIQQLEVLGAENAHFEGEASVTENILEVIRRFSPQILLVSLRDVLFSGAREKLEQSEQNFSLREFSETKNGAVFLIDDGQFALYPEYGELYRFQMLAEILYPEDLYFGFEGIGWQRFPGGNSDRLAAWHFDHYEACKAGLERYQMAGSRYPVMTALSHLRRGECCGSKCRHCPYGNAPAW